MEGMWLFVGACIVVMCACNILHWNEIFNHFRNDDEEDKS